MPTFSASTEQRPSPNTLTTSLYRATVTRAVILGTLRHGLVGHEQFRDDRFNTE